MDKSKRLHQIIGTKQVLNICPETGIQTKTEVPGIGKWAFTSIHPFADYENCLDYIREIQKTGKALDSLSSNLLAGMFLTILKEKNLLAEWQDIQQANFLLSQVSSETLAKAIFYYRKIQFNRKSMDYPKFVFNGSQPADSLIISHIKICNREDADIFTRKDFITLNEEKETKVRIKILVEGKKIKDWKARAKSLRPLLLAKYPSKSKSIENWVLVVKSSAGALPPTKAQELMQTIKFALSENNILHPLAASFIKIFEEMAQEKVLRDDDFFSPMDELAEEKESIAPKASFMDILNRKMGK